MPDQPDTAERLLAAVETALGDQLTPTARTQALDSIRHTLAVRDAELDRLRAKLEHIEAEQEEYEETVVGDLNEINVTLTKQAHEAKAEADRLRAELERLRTHVQSAADEARGSVRDWLLDALADSADPREPSTAQTMRDRAEQAEAAIERVRVLHQPVEGLGYGADDDNTPGSYGDIAQVCSSCGTADEYGVRWPCPTIAALDGEQPATTVDRQTAVVLSGLHRSAEDTVTRVIELAERWHRDGPPPGNRALDELRTALNQPKETQP